MFDKQIYKSRSWDIPLICVGNLHIGGSGKTPFTEWLLANLPSENIAVLSRGYGRKSSGYKVVKADGDAREFGDEPLQVKNKFPEVPFVVCEDRNEGVGKIRKEFAGVKAIILDDAFQHRKIKCGFNILLTPYRYLYVNDTFLPIGSLRDDKKSAERAQVVLVSKCPGNIGLAEKMKVKEELKLLPSQHLFFSETIYGNPFKIWGDKIDKTHKNTVLILAGIAHPSVLEDELRSQFPFIETAYFSDHHNYTEQEIKDVIRQYHSIKNEHKFLITTEKDFQRLKPFLHFFKELNLYVQPIETHILFDEGKDLLNLIDQFFVTFE